MAGNIKVIGCYSDQCSLAPSNMATSFELNLGGMVISIAEFVANGAFAGGSEWRPPVDRTWLQKCGAGGEYNPRLITADQWSQFRKVWADIAAGKVDLDAILAAP